MAEVLTGVPEELKTTGLETMTPLQTQDNSYYYQDPNANMTQSEAGNLLSLYNLDPNDLYSQANIESSLVRPNAAPDDLLGIRDQNRYDTGYAAEKKKFDLIEKALNDYAVESKKGALDIGQWLQRHEAVVGEQEAYLNQRELGIENLTRERNTLANRLNELGEEVNYRTQIAEKNINLINEIKLTNPGIKIKYGDSIDKISDKLKDYIKEQEKDAEKKALKEEARNLGLSTKGSRNELRERISKLKGESYARSIEAENISLQSARLQLQKLQQSMSGGGGNGGFDEKEWENIKFDSDGNGYSSIEDINNQSSGSSSPFSFVYSNYSNYSQ